MGVPPCPSLIGPATAVAWQRDADRDRNGYDAGGNTVALTGTTGLVTRLGYDAASRLIGATLADGTAIAADYNAFGQRASYTVTPAGGGAATYSARFRCRGEELGEVRVTGVSSALRSRSLHL